MESNISLVTNKLVTTILLLALALLAKKYRHLLREVLREMVLRETKRGFCCVVPCVVMFCGVVFSVTYLVTCLAVALLWSKIDSLHSTRVREAERLLYCASTSASRPDCIGISYYLIPAIANN